MITRFTATKETAEAAMAALRRNAGRMHGSARLCELIEAAIARAMNGPRAT